MIELRRVGGRDVDEEPALTHGRVQTIQKPAEAISALPTQPITAPRVFLPRAP